MKSVKGKGAHDGPEALEGRRKPDFQRPIGAEPDVAGTAGW